LIPVNEADHRQWIERGCYIQWDQAMNRLARLFPACLSVCLLLGLSPVLPVQAGIQNTPIPVVNVQDSIPPVSITFKKLGYEGQTFNSSYGMAGFTFTMPDEWQIESGSSIQLKYTVRMPDSEKNKALATGGYSVLYVHLNYTQIAFFPLRESGAFVINIPISLWVAPPLNDGSNILEFVFKNDDACKYDNGISIYIDPESTVNIKPFLQPTAPKLTTLPRPFFYRNSIIPGFHTTMVVPDKPTPAELQAALAAAASLGSMAESTSDISLVSESGLTDAIKVNDHLIFVGKSLSLPTLRKLVLLSPLDPIRGFSSASIEKADGVIQFNNSPWNLSRAAMIISGDTDEAVVKAGQSLRTRFVTQWGYYGLAVIKKLQAAPAQPTPIPGIVPAFYEKTFKDLGYRDSTVTGLGSFSLDYYFYLPAESINTRDSYINLNITPSDAISLPESLIYVYLNGHPISNIFLDKNKSARQTIKVDVPAAQVHTGRNHLSVAMKINATNRCDNSINAYGNMKKNLWTMTVHADSLIHIAFGTGQPGEDDLTVAAGLGSYGEQLAYNPSLENVAFVLPPDNPAAWEAAARVAFRLGNKGNTVKTEKGPVLLHTFFTGDNLAANAANFDIVRIAKDEKLDMPATGTAQTIDAGPTIHTYDSPVTYDMLPGVSVGRVELAASQWNAERSMLSLTGYDNNGLTLAADALILQKYQDFLTGSSILTNGVQVVYDKP
jgi:hypothetical protein